MDGTDERIKSKENARRRWLKRRVMSGQVKKTERWEWKKVSRHQKGGGRKRRGGGGSSGNVDNGSIAENGSVMSGEKVEEYGENAKG